MNCFLFIFMITLTVVTSNPYDVSYGEIMDLVNNLNSLKNEYEMCKDRNIQLENKIQMLISASTAPEPTLRDEDRVEQCGVISSVADESITASSTFGSGYYWGTQNARLNTVSGNGGWNPDTDKGSWIQIDMDTKKTVKGVATQGSARSYYRFWTESFTIGYKTSTSSNFQNIEDQSGARKIFQGNTDADSVVINDVDVEARFIRIYPITWYRALVLRFDVLLC